MVILERRSQAGKVLFRSLSGGWNGSEEDKYRLHEQLELLQKDPAYLSSDATLPELINEMAPVGVSRHTLNHACDNHRYSKQKICVFFTNLIQIFVF